MTSRLHVGLPDEMHASGRNPHMTLDEDVPIRADMVQEEDRRCVIRFLLRVKEEFGRGELLPLLVLDAVDAELTDELR